jgi:hypothetical protein
MIILQIIKPILTVCRFANYCHFYAAWYPCNLYHKLLSVTLLSLIPKPRSNTSTNDWAQWENHYQHSIHQKARIPLTATIIDGQGKYLLPGLTDAHIHFFQSGGLYTRPDAIDFRKKQPYKNELLWVHENMEDLLRRYTRVGITSVFDVGANYHFLQQRDSFITKSYAPTIYMTGPLLTSWLPPEFDSLQQESPFILVKTVADAKKYVQEQLPYHPDFIKIWYIINAPNVEKEASKLLPVITAIIEEAHKNNLKVAVHATERITAQLAVENGADFLVHDIEDEIINDDFIKLLKERKPAYALH